ncbi:MAG: hypothetical protein COB24_13560 [Hyphomicrobiales bacterium]|nr:MAG: hypothetical protein COB24_13560 [Hyphomicrobiales bacterium]
MQEILLVRHGQASYGAHDYDNLSELGHQQSFWLGAHLQQLGFVPSLAVDGTLKRHVQTLDQVAKSLHISNQASDKAFSEINIKAIFTAYRNKYDNLPAFEQDTKLLNAALRMVLTAWFEARISTGGETWQGYIMRINQGLERFKNQGDNILLITSGGAIAAAVGATLNLDAATQVAIFTKLHNSSVTKLIRTKSGLELHSLNNVAHLETADRKGALTYV